MVVGLNSSIGQYNGILNNGVQYPAIQGYTYQPQIVSFQGTPQQAEETSKKKSSAVKKGIIAGLVTAAATAIALYAGVKTGVLKEVKDPKTFTDKLKNLAFKGGDTIDKGITGLTTWTKTKLGKKADGEMKPFPEKDANGQLYFQFAPNEAPKAETKVPNIKVNFTEGEVGEEELRELMQGMNNGAKSGTCKSGAKWEIIG